MAGWLTLDVLLDRANVAGGWACAGLTLGGGALLTGLWWAGARTAPGTSSSGRLFFAAALTSGITGSAYWINGAGDTPRPWPTLWPLILTGAGTAVVVGCLMAAGAGRVRMLRAAGCGLLAFLAVSAVAVGLGWLSIRIPAMKAIVDWPLARIRGFALPPFLAAYIGIGLGGPMMLLLTVVALLAWDARGVHGSWARRSPSTSGGR